MNSSLCIERPARIRAARAGSLNRPLSRPLIWAVALALLPLAAAADHSGPPDAGTDADIAHIAAEDGADAASPYGAPADLAEELAGDPLQDALGEVLSPDPEAEAAAEFDRAIREIEQEAAAPMVGSAPDPDAFPGRDGAAVPDPAAPAPAAAAEGAVIQGWGDANAFAASPAMPKMPQGSLSHLPVVVELFTSQGCSNCPPADAMVEGLADLPDVLPLTFHVDYWDYLGWADSFASPAFTRRQQGYARAAGERAVYTPQVIVDGQDTALSLRPAELMALVDAHRAAPALISIVPHQQGEQRRWRLSAVSDLGGPVAVALVHYLPRREVEVTAGENRGKVLAYRNIVVKMQKLADWDGRAALDVTAPAAAAAGQGLPPDTLSAVIVQQIEGRGGLPGPILAALRLD